MVTRPPIPAPRRAVYVELGRPAPSGHVAAEVPPPCSSVLARTSLLRTGERASGLLSTGPSAPRSRVCGGPGRDLDWDGEHPSTPPRAASETPQWTDPLGLQKTRFGNCHTLPGPPQRACFWLRLAARSRRWGEPGQAWPPHGSRSNRRAACGADTQPLSRRLSEAAQQLGCFPGGGTGWLAGSGPR